MGCVMWWHLLLQKKTKGKRKQQCVNARDNGLHIPYKLKGVCEWTVAFFPPKKERHNKQQVNENVTHPHTLCIYISTMILDRCFSPFFLCSSSLDFTIRAEYSSQARERWEIHETQRGKVDREKGIKGK